MASKAKSKVLQDDSLIYQLTDTIDAVKYYFTLGRDLLGSQAAVSNIIGRTEPDYQEIVFKCLYTWRNANGRGSGAKLVKIFRGVGMYKAATYIEQELLRRPNCLSEDVFLQNLASKLGCVSVYRKLGLPLLENNSAKLSNLIGPVHISTAQYQDALFHVLILWRNQEGSRRESVEKLKKILMKHKLTDTVQALNRMEYGDKAVERMAKWAMDQGGPDDLFFHCCEMPFCIDDPSFHCCEMPFCIDDPSFHCREMLFYIDERHRVKMSNDIKGDDAHRIMVTIYAISKDGIRNNNSKVRVEWTFIEHLENTLDELKQTWARRITYTMGMICTTCQEYRETIFIPLDKFLSYKGKRVCCDGCGASISVARVQQCIGRRFDGASGDRVSAHCDMVSDSKLNILARHVPHAAYYCLSDGLKVEYNQAQNILHKHCNDSTGAIRECLAMWKNRTGGRLTELKEILHRAEIGGLVKYLEYVKQTQYSQVYRP